MKIRQTIVSLALFALVIVQPAFGQWTNRYPMIANVSHHIYLEGFNLPTMNIGPTDPAVAPDDRRVAFAARGWIWIMDIESREARRLTRSASVDSRPAWSPDGRSIVFVRDDSRDTDIVLVDPESGVEKILVDSTAMDLDPSFSPDGRIIYYSSAEAGDLDLWKIDVGTGIRTRLTTDRGQEMQPQAFADNSGLFFLAKVTASSDTIQTLRFSDGSKKVIRDEGIASNMRPALAKDGKNFVFNIPLQDRWHLWIGDLRGQLPIQIAANSRYPQMPAWSSDGRFVYFADPDSEERFQLRRVRSSGGDVEDLSPRVWNWGQPTSRVTVTTRSSVNGQKIAARISATTNGHPVLPDAGIVRFDGQNGQVFYYSDETVTFEVPAGEFSVQATRGFGSPATKTSKSVKAGEAAAIEINLQKPLWDPMSDGWYSADLHSHLNYGGPYLLEPNDIVLDMKGEALDLATPQLANLHTRFNDVEWWNWRRTTFPLIHFAQEVRSHFLGHVSVVGADSLFFPWYNGPGYPVYSQLDLPNSEALRFARERGGMNSYVHPVSNGDPFPSDKDPIGLPLELVPDALAGDVDTLEIVCLWSDERGTSEAWYRLLNLGIPIAPSAGSDTMQNLYRTMPIGSTRVYAKPDGTMNLQNFLHAVKKGRSFVTNGPLMKFTVNGSEPGDVIRGGGSAEWKLEAFSAGPVEKVEIMVNGKAVWTGAGFDGAKTFSGRITVPDGGWVAVRVHGGPVNPPFTDSYPFAHSAPVWIGSVGSIDPSSAKSAALDLLRWMNVAERRLNQGYEGSKVENLRRRFADARRLLEAKAK